MKKFLFSFMGWLAIMAAVFFGFYNQSITEYRKIDPITSEPYGEMGYYTNWTMMVWFMVGITVIYFAVFFIVASRKKK